MKTKSYTIYPGQIKIDNEIFYGVDHTLCDFVNELATEYIILGDKADGKEEDDATVSE